MGSEVDEAVGGDASEESEPINLTFEMLKSREGVGEKRAREMLGMPPVEES